MTHRGRGTYTAHGRGAMIAAALALVAVYLVGLLFTNSAVPAGDASGNANAGQQEGDQGAGEATAAGASSGQGASANGNAAAQGGTDGQGADQGGVTGQQAQGDPTAPLDVTSGRENLDALGDDEAECVSSVVSFLGREGIDTDGLKVSVPKASETIPTSGERVIWFVLTDRGKALSAQGQTGGVWSAGWISGDSATELGIEVPSAKAIEGPDTTYEPLSTSQTMTTLFGTPGLARLCTAWDAWAKQNAPDVDTTQTLVDADHVDTQQDTGETQVILADPTSGRRFFASFADPSASVTFTEGEAGSPISASDGDAS